MQIIHWLIRVAYDQPPGQSATSPPCKGSTTDDKQITKDIVLFNKQGKTRRRLRKAEQSRLNCENFNLFNLLCRRDISKDCFYSTLNQKQLEISHRRTNHRVRAMKMMKKENAEPAESSASSHVGNTKVLPITDSAVSSSARGDDQCVPVDKKDRAKSDHKTKTISKMKELLRWAAAAKSENGGKYLGRKVFQFRTRSTLKAVPDDDELSNESPKISFRWDVESCSTTSSVYSAISLASSTKNNDQAVNMASVNSTPAHDRDHCVARRGNWITSDSEFVVLEL